MLHEATGTHMRSAIRSTTGRNVVTGRLTADAPAEAAEAAEAPPEAAEEAAAPAADAADAEAPPSLAAAAAAPEGAADVFIMHLAPLHRAVARLQQAGGPEGRRHAGTAMVVLGSRRRVWQGSTREGQEPRQTHRRLQLRPQMHLKQAAGANHVCGVVVSTRRKRDRMRGDRAVCA